MGRKSKFTEDDFIKRCNELNLQYVGYCIKPHVGSVIQFICPKHKEKGIQEAAFSHFKDAKVGCPYCYGRGKTTKDIIPFIKDKNIELLSEYLGCEKPIKCRCKKCGNIWSTVPKVLTTNGSGCPKCGKISAANLRRKTKDSFIRELQIINPNIEVLGDYNGVHTKIKCKCRIDGTVWDAYPANLLNLSAGCPKCNLSGSERKMLNILESMGIKAVTQYIIDDCKHIHKLRFDAYDIENNIAFEYNGEQHYYPIDFAGRGEEWAKLELEKTKQRDKAKYQYCSNHNIPIIVIPYWEKDNMEKYIREKLKGIGVCNN